MEKEKNFNEVIRQRSHRMALDVFHLTKEIKENSLSTVPVKQLLRCSSSVAANWRAATRARSDEEFYSKVCIVTEESDETVYWIDQLIDFGYVDKQKTEPLRDEALQLLKIFASIKSKMRRRLGK